MLPFVGRERELTRLRARLAAVQAGRGGLVLLAGEAGIGKTTLARAFTASVAAAGAQVLWGSCREGQWQPPFGPWVEALVEPLREQPPDSLRQLLGTTVGGLPRLFPQLTALFPDLPSPLGLIPAEERLHLAEAVVYWLLTLAKTAPLVLVLDDLHWADRDSLDLLRYVARATGRAAVLVIGIYRTPDLDFEQNEGLRDVLGVLPRETAYEHLSLGGLTGEQVVAYLAEASGGAPTPVALAETLHHGTGGNPFFLSECYRHLVEEGALAAASQPGVGLPAIPPGVTQVVLRRFERLSAPTRTLLAQVSACSAGFTFALAQALTALAEDALLDSLDEALHAGFLGTSDAAGTPSYDFAHTIVRQILYTRISPDRRVRLHRRIAEALAAIHGERAGAHAGELAVQYHASRSLPDAARGLPHALTAAELAQVSAAYQQAADYLRLGRDLAAGESAAVRADVLWRLARAEADALRFADACQIAEEATTLALASGAAPETVADALVGVAYRLQAGGASARLRDPLVARGIALLGEARTLTWARLTLLRDRFEPALVAGLNVGRWRSFDPEAVALARVQGDELDYARTLSSYEVVTRAETDAMLALALTWHNPQAIVQVFRVALYQLQLCHGDLHALVGVANELLALAERQGALAGRAYALLYRASGSLHLGERAAADADLQEVRVLLGRLPTITLMHTLEHVVSNQFAYLYEGDWQALEDDARAAVAEPPTTSAQRRLGGLQYAVYSLYRAGAVTEAEAALATLATLHEHLDPASFVYEIWQPVSLIWERQLAVFAARYLPIARRIVAESLGNAPTKGNELSLARLAAVLGDHAEAEAAFALARSRLAAVGMRPLRALVDYDEALALVRAGAADRTRIATLLDVAAAQFQALGMAGWTERARGLLATTASPQPDELAPRRPAPTILTARETEILRLLAGGLLTREIAEQLSISFATVERHISNIYSKIAARGRADATAYAIRHGLI